MKFYVLAVGAAAVGGLAAAAAFVGTSPSAGPHQGYEHVHHSSVGGP